MDQLTLFSLAAKLTLDKAGFDKGVDDADKAGRGLSDNLQNYAQKIKGFVDKLAFVTTLRSVTKGLWNLAKDTSMAGDRIDKQSQALGMSRKAFQEWGYILEQCGASIDDMGMAMKTMSNAISENSAETAAGLAKLGLSAAQLQNMTPEDQLETLVKAFQEMPDGAEKSKLAMQLFGRNAQSLMPLLNSASGTVDELRQRAHDLGLIMSDEAVDASVAFGDALGDLNAVWTAVKQKFGAQMLPMLTNGLVKAANALGRVSNALEKAFKTGDWKEVFSVISEEINNLLPSLMDTVFNVVIGIVENAPKIVELAATIITGLASALGKGMPKLAAKMPQIWETVKTALKSVALSLGNGIIDTLNTLFGWNLPNITEIRWPTWPEVQAGFNKAWELIKAEAGKIMRLVFGETEDGAIDWKGTWEKVKAGFLKMWHGEDGNGGIKGGAKKIMRLVFGEDENGNIDWAGTWEKVKAGFLRMWQGEDGNGGIKGEAKKLLRFVFGEDEDGNIDWAGTWQKVKAGFLRMWQGEDGNGGIKGEAKKLLRLVFGEDADGNIDWAGTWDKVKEKFRVMWDRIKAKAHDLMVLIFGQTEDGGIKWPKAAVLWGKIRAGLKNLWEAIKERAKHIFTFLFGETEDGGIKWPSVPRLWGKIRAGIKNLWEGIKSKARDIFHFVFGEREDGGIKWPSAATVWGKIRQGLRNLWEGIKSKAKGIFRFVFGEREDGGFDVPDGETMWGKIKERIIAAWGVVKEKAKDALHLTSSFFVSIGARLGLVDENGKLKFPDNLEEKFPNLTAKLRDILQKFGFVDSAGNFIWPEWLVSLADFVKEKIKDVLKFLGFIYEDTDGNLHVSLPGWVKGLMQLRNVLLKQILRLFGITFKEDGEGNIDPTDLENGINSLLDNLKEILRTLGFVKYNEEHGQDEFTIPDWIGKTIEGIFNLAKEILKALGFVVEDADGGIKLQIPEWLSGLITFFKDTLTHLGEALGFFEEVAVKDKEGNDVYDEDGNLVTRREIKLPEWLKSFIGAIKTVVEGILGMFGFIEEYEDEQTHEMKKRLVLPDWLKEFVSIIARVIQWIAAFVGQIVDFLFKDKQVGYHYEKSEYGTPMIVSDVNEGGGPNWAADALSEPSVSDYWGYSNMWDDDQPAADDYGPQGWAVDAKGLNYVPYDGYRAILHRGETILNQNQGRKWREGGYGGINSERLYDAVAQAVAAAVGDIQINMDGNLVGNAVAGTVSRNIYQQARSRRYGG